MSHYHYHYEAHNKEKPDGSLEDPVTIQISLAEADIVMAEAKARALTTRKHLRLERVLECDPFLENPWREDDYNKLERHLDGGKTHAGSFVLQKG